MDELILIRRMGAIFCQIEQSELDLLKEMAAAQLKKEQAKYDKLTQFALETVTDKDKRDRLVERIAYLKRIINTQKLPYPDIRGNNGDTEYIN